MNLAFATEAPKRAADVPAARRARHAMAACRISRNSTPHPGKCAFNDIRDANERAQGPRRPAKSAGASEIPVKQRRHASCRNQPVTNPAPYGSAKL
jgi:hypothetical protein